MIKEQLSCECIVSILIVRILTQCYILFSFLLKQQIPYK